MDLVGLWSMAHRRHHFDGMGCQCFEKCAAYIHIIMQAKQSAAALQMVTATGHISTLFNTLGVCQYNISMNIAWRVFCCVIAVVCATIVTDFDDVFRDVPVSTTQVPVLEYERTLGCGRVWALRNMISQLRKEWSADFSGPSNFQLVKKANHHRHTP